MVNDQASYDQCIKDWETTQIKYLMDGLSISEADAKTKFEEVKVEEQNKRDLEARHPKPELDYYAEPMLNGTDKLILAGFKDVQDKFRLLGAT